MALLKRFPWVLAAIVALSVYLAKRISEDVFGLADFYALMFGTLVAGIICAGLCLIVEKVFDYSIFPPPQNTALADSQGQHHGDTETSKEIDRD